MTLHFDKSIIDGGNIDGLRDDEADCTFLARDTVPPYMEDRPLQTQTARIQMRVCPEQCETWFVQR